MQGKTRQSSLAVEDAANKTFSSTEEKEKSFMHVNSSTEVELVFTE